MQEFSEIQPYGVPTAWQDTGGFSNANLATLIGGTANDTKKLVAEFEELARTAGEGSTHLWGRIIETDPHGTRRQAIWDRLNRDPKWMGKLDFSRATTGIHFPGTVSDAGIAMWQKTFRQRIEERVRQKRSELSKSEGGKTPGRPSTPYQSQSQSDNVPQYQAQSATKSGGPPASDLHFQYLTLVLKAATKFWTIACRELNGGEIGYQMMDADSLKYDKLVARVQEITSLDPDMSTFDPNTSELQWIDGRDWKRIDSDWALENALRMQVKRFSAWSLKIYLDVGEVGKTITGSPVQKQKRQRRV
ncbi:hypothetical protein LTR97_001487 [Elasticomyces elasticus]|uniref:Uncharacterized protein n=1 Tax=Elasticomyces elasticus TaxID=574655 RepID=A0AAN7VW73_9PEZI|nr:hypothetical protein LTR97_001487 [Elasticomyces elasticus]